MSNKSETRNSCKTKANSAPFDKKRSASAIQICKVKSDRFNKSKLQSSTFSKLPVCSKPVRKAHNCVEPAAPVPLRKTPSFLRRKSVSLVELTADSPRTRIWTPKKWESKENLDECKILEEIAKTKHEESFLSSNETGLAQRVCKMFILNAWRHSRVQVFSLQNKVTKMSNEVDNLNIQVVVLRNLLESEKLRVAVAMSDAAHLKLRLENELKVNHELKIDVSHLKEERNAWKNLEEKMNCEIHKLKEELTLTSEQNKYLRRECDDFAKAISEVKQSENRLQKQLNEVTSILREKEENEKEVKNNITALLLRLAELKKRNQNILKENENKERKINECINKISEMNVELNNSHNICKVQSEDIEELKEELVKVEEKLATQTMDVENLKNTVEKYENEKEEYSNNLKKTRNRIIFEAIKISASLLFPYHPYL